MSKTRRHQRNDERPSAEFKRMEAMFEAYDAELANDWHLIEDDETFMHVDALASSVTQDDAASDETMQELADALGVPAIRVRVVREQDVFLPSFGRYALQDALDSAVQQMIQYHLSASASEIGRLDSDIGQLQVNSSTYTANPETEAREFGEFRNEHDTPFPEPRAFSVYDEFDRGEECDTLLEALALAFSWMHDDAEYGASYTIHAGDEDFTYFFENTAADRTPDASLLGLEYDGRAVGIWIMTPEQEEAPVQRVTEQTVVPYRVTYDADPVDVTPSGLNTMYTLWIVDEYGTIRSRSCHGATDLLRSFWSALQDMAESCPDDTVWGEALLHEGDDDVKSAMFGVCNLWEDDSPQFSAWYERTKTAKHPHEWLWQGVYVLGSGDMAEQMPDYFSALSDAVGEMLVKNVPAYSMSTVGYEFTSGMVFDNAFVAEQAQFDDFTVRWNGVKRGGWTQQIIDGSRSLWRQ